MKKSDIVPAWGRILMGYRPFLSIEIQRNVPSSARGATHMSQSISAPAPISGNFPIFGAMIS